MPKLDVGMTVWGASIGCMTEWGQAESVYPPFLQYRQHGTLFRRGFAAPIGDFIDGPQASPAKFRYRIDHADTRTGGRYGFRRYGVVLRHRHRSAAAIIRSARASPLR